jgi:hypothetical protein
MIVEHAFITTRDGAEVQASARDLLSMLGFSPTGPSGPARPDHLDLSRGRRHARQAVYRLELQPQRVRIEFDRGRVTVAASIEPHGRPDNLHRELLVMLATLIEERVVGGADPAELRARWEELHARIQGYNRKKRLPRDIILALLILFFVAVVVAVVLSA